MLNKKGFLILALVIFALTACSKDSSPRKATQPDNSSRQTIQTENKDDKTKNTNQTISKSNSQENANKNEIEAQDGSNKNNKTETKAQDQPNKNEAKAQNGTKIQGEVYTNRKLGFSFLIPKDWSGKYTIKEKEEGVYVSFKPSVPAKEGYSGMLFSITKRTSPEDEDHLDTVGEPRTFEAKGVTYIVGGPTDVTFPSEHKEFGDFTRMQKEIRDVVKTIRSSN